MAVIDQTGTNHFHQRDVKRFLHSIINNSVKYERFEASGYSLGQKLVKGYLDTRSALPVFMEFMAVWCMKIFGFCLTPTTLFVSFMTAVSCRIVANFQVQTQTKQLSCIMNNCSSDILKRSDAEMHIDNI